MELPAQVALRVGETYVLRLKGLGAAGYHVAVLNSWSW